MVVGVARVRYCVIRAGPVGVQFDRAQRPAEFVVIVVGRGFAAGADDLIDSAHFIVQVVQGVPLLDVSRFCSPGYPAVVVVVDGDEIHADQFPPVGAALNLAVLAVAHEQVVVRSGVIHDVMLDHVVPLELVIPAGFRVAGVAGRPRVLILQLFHEGGRSARSRREDRPVVFFGALV